METFKVIGKKFIDGEMYVYVKDPAGYYGWNKLVPCELPKVVEDDPSEEQDLTTWHTLEY